MVDDFRHAFRALLREPGLSLAAIVTLALGLGATVAVFSIGYGVLVRPLPFPNAERLVQLTQMIPSSIPGTSPTRAGLTVPQLQALRANSRTLSHIGYFRGRSMTLTGAGRTTRLNGREVSPLLFEAAGVQPWLGHGFAIAAEEAVDANTVVLSYRTWRRQLGSNTDVVGKSIQLDGIPHRIVGVMPDGFEFPPIGNPYQSPDDLETFEDAPQFWIPLTLASLVQLSEANSGGATFDAIAVGTTFALLRRETTIERAAGEVNVLTPALSDGRQVPIDVISARDAIGARVEVVLAAFQIGVAFLLLISCANVANLLIVRSARKQHDLAIRMAIGASRAHIVRQSVAEAVVLSLAGGAVGGVLAYQIVQAARLLPPDLLPRAREIRIDSGIFALGIALSIISGALAGVFAAIRTTYRAEGVLAWGSASLWLSTKRHREWPSEIAVAVQVAAAMVLLMGAGLFANSFVRLLTFEQGLRPAGVLTFRLGLPRDSYPNGVARLTFYDQLALGLQRVPGVRSVAATTQPFNSVANGERLRVEGVPAEPSTVNYRYVTPDYFRTVGMPILRGRDFTLADRRTVKATSVVIVNESFARRHFGTLDVLGRHLGFGFWPDLQIVGVVGDTRPIVLSVESARREVYLPPDTDRGLPIFTGVMLTSGDPIAYASAVRDVIERIDPDVTAWEYLPLEQVLSRGMGVRARLYAYASTLVAATALLLSAIGLYSVLAYSVGSRVREIGIRIALGSSRRAVIWMIVGRGLVLTACGLVIGVAIAAAGTRTLHALLFEVTPADPATLSSAVVVLITVGLVASYIPARRASRVDPITALRAE